MGMTSLFAADPALLFWLLVVLHLAGVASTFLLRLPSASQGHGWCQHAFVACLVLVGAATMFTICMQSSFWVWSGTTFSLMAVGATIDLEAPARTSGI